MSNDVDDTALYFTAMNGQLNCTCLILDQGAFIDEDDVNSIEDLDQECKHAEQNRGISIERKVLLWPQIKYLYNVVHSQGVSIIFFV